MGILARLREKNKQDNRIITKILEDMSMLYDVTKDGLYQKGFQVATVLMEKQLEEEKARRKKSDEERKKSDAARKKLERDKIAMIQYLLVSTELTTNAIAQIANVEERFVIELKKGKE